MMDRRDGSSGGTMDEIGAIRDVKEPVPHRTVVPHLVRLLCVPAADKGHSKPQ